MLWFCLRQHGGVTWGWGWGWGWSHCSLWVWPLFPFAFWQSRRERTALQGIEKNPTSKIWVEVWISLKFCKTLSLWIVSSLVSSSVKINQFLKMLATDLNKSYTWIKWCSHNCNYLRKKKSSYKTKWYPLFFFLLATGKNPMWAPEMLFNFIYHILGLC